MEESDKLKLLMYEYAALNAQLLSRYTSQFAVYSMIAAVSAALVLARFATHTLGWTLFGYFIGLVAAVGLWLWLYMDREVAKIAMRLRQIEERVNKAAGEDLLVWESQKWGLGGTIGKRLFVKPPRKPSEE